jgi:hypothetical protein
MADQTGTPPQDGDERCGLCGHVRNLARCGHANADNVYLCHADDHSCYHRWTVYGERPQDGDEIETLRKALTEMQDGGVPGAYSGMVALDSISRRLTEVSEERDIYYWELNDPRGALTESRERVERYEAALRELVQASDLEAVEGYGDQTVMAPVEFFQAVRNALSTPDSEPTGTV